MRNALKHGQRVLLLASQRVMTFGFQILCCHLSLFDFHELLLIVVSLLFELIVDCCLTDQHLLHCFFLYSYRLLHQCTDAGADTNTKRSNATNVDQSNNSQQSTQKEETPQSTAAHESQTGKDDSTKSENQTSSHADLPEAGHVDHVLKHCAFVKHF